MDLCRQLKLDDEAILIFGTFVDDTGGRHSLHRRHYSGWGVLRDQNAFETKRHLRKAF